MAATKSKKKAKTVKTDKSKPFQVNKYKIRWNPLFKEWQVSHPKIGHCADFKLKSEAIRYAKNG